VLGFDFGCMACHWGADVLVEYAKNKKSVEDFLSATSTLCHLFGIYSKVAVNYAIIKKILKLRASFRKFVMIKKILKLCATFMKFVMIKKDPQMMC
jgi:hypothetical protein